MKVILKGQTIKSKADFHKQIKDVLDLPAYYGNNLDALWDCITSGEIPLPLTLVWENFNTSKHYLGAYADKLVELLEDAASEVEGLKFTHQN